MQSFAVLMALLFASGTALAQTPGESPPNEPPYTSVEEQFDSATKTATPTTDLKAGEGEGLEDLLDKVEPAPAPTAESSEAVIEAEPQELALEPEQTQSRDTGGGEVLRIGTDRKKFIRHPGAKQGLRLIDRDGSYYYSTKKTSSKTETSIFRVGSIRPPSIVSADGVTTYSTMYGSSNPMTLMYDYEWKPLKAFGAMGVQIGAGFFTATGQGRFIRPELQPPGEEPIEKYTFFAFPISVGGVYRFQYADGQWAAPYIAGGGTYFALAEMRDDGKTPKFVGTPAGYGAGGLMVNLSALDRETGFNLDAEYGINTLWLNFEVRQIQSSNKDLDFSGTMFSMGVSADY